MAENIRGGETTSYSCTRSFSRSEGLVHLPVNGTVDGSEPSIAVRTMSPIETMSVTWTASRRGGPPKVPHPMTFEGVYNVVLMSKTVSAPIPTPLGNGLGHEWVMGGIYTYMLRKPRSHDEKFATGKVPFEKGGPNENTIPESYFDKKILGTDGLSGK